MRIDHGQHLVAEAGFDRTDGETVFLDAGPPPAEAAGWYLQRDFDRQIWIMTKPPSAPIKDSV
jgi:hypothetical protein